MRINKLHQKKQIFKMKNIFVEPLKTCCTKPLTGFYRDGNCRTDEFDRGSL